MPGFWDFVTALGLALVIEGVLYALFPDQFRRFMQLVAQSETGQLRMAGLTCMAAGVAIVWLARG